MQRVAEQKTIGREKKVSHEAVNLCCLLPSRRLSCDLGWLLTVTVSFTSRVFHTGPCLSVFEMQG